MAAPSPKANPPPSAARVSDQPLMPLPAAGTSQKKGNDTAHTHSTDLPTLPSMAARRELAISATARTVQTLARWAAKPMTRASTTARTRRAIAVVPLVLGGEDRG